MQKLLILLTLPLSVFLGGCESTQPTVEQVGIVTALDSRLKLDTSPSGAQVWEDGNLIGRTPLSVRDTGDKLLVLYKEGFIPSSLLISSPFGDSVKIGLERTNIYIYNVLAEQGVRFVRRSSLGAVMVEPLNHVVSEGYGYTFYDPLQNSESILVVTDIEQGHIKLRTKDGSSVFFPVFNL